MKYAGFWRRFGAYIIDSIVLTVGLGIILLLLDAIGIGMFEGVETDAAAEGMSASAEASAELTALGGLITFLAGWLYFAILESSAWQATLGKLALGVRVTGLDGQRIGFGRATGRTFAKILSTIILYIGFIMAAFTARKQALHDMIAGTLVIHRPLV